MNEVPVSSGRLDWYSAVGNLILNFGTLEWLILVYLERHLAVEEFERCRKRHFKDRLTMVGRLLKEESGSTAEPERVEQMWEGMEALRVLRNHVAHAHFNIHLDEAGKPRMTLALPRDFDQPYGGDSKILEFAELREGLDRLNEATEWFKHLSGFGASEPNTM